MKINGQDIVTRPSNKLYHQLDDLDWLFEELKKKTISELAKELDLPQNSVRFRVMQYFPDDWKKQIKKSRKWKDLPR